MKQQQAEEKKAVDTAVSTGFLTILVIYMKKPTWIPNLNYLWSMNEQNWSPANFLNPLRPSLNSMIPILKDAGKVIAVAAAAGGTVYIGLRAYNYWRHRNPQIVQVQQNQQVHQPGPKKG